MGALDGYKVLDLSILVQGPQAAAMLHDLGADVVKIELPGMGDLSRWLHFGDLPWCFEACNRGKRSVTLDLRQPGGAKALKRLVVDADVIVSNFAPGTMEGWGLGYDVLAEINPRLVYAAGSFVGHLGEDAWREGADTVGQAVGGLVSTVGTDGTEPSPVGALVADHIGSQNLVVGVLGALLARERTGRGQRVEVSLLGGQIWAQASEITAYLLTGNLPGRANRGHPMIKGLLRLFPTADGWLQLVGVPAPLWPAFCEAIERPDLLDKVHYTALGLPEEQRAEIIAILDDVFRTRTTAEWTERLRAARQRFSPVRDYTDVVADPQSWANGYFVEGEHPTRGAVRVVGSPIWFSDTPARTAIVAPELGAHTEEVLLEAGFGWDEIEQLRAEGAY